MIPRRWVLLAQSRFLLRTLAVLLPVVAVSYNVFAAVDAPADRPNIVFIRADDLGYADLGCYGQTKIKTPRLDRMAAEGIRFRKAYCGTSVCAPSRCILMTGLHAGHAHIRANRGVDAEGEDPLPAGTFTVARMLQQAGYRTACIGKWGLGGPRSSGAPNKQGFDYFFGYTGHGQAHEYYPDHLWRNDQRVALDGKTYSHDRIVEESFRWIRANHGRPFFLYLPLTIPHAKLQVPDLGPYADEKWPPDAKAIAAMITRMDRDVGRLIDLLKELGLDEKTIVFFASDNGPDRGRIREFFKASGSFRGSKRGMYEGGLRVPVLVRWPGRIPADVVSDEPWAFWDFLPTCAELAGIMMPPDARRDGLSIVPALRGGAMPKRDCFYWEIHEPWSSQAVRFGDIKAIRPAWDAPIEVYDVKADPGETRNLASERPDLRRTGEDLLRRSRVDSSRWPILLPSQATRPGAASRPAATMPWRGQGAARPVVGAIRWDAWHGDRGAPGRAVEKTLGPKQWHDRLPFFAKVLSDERVEVCGDTQAVVDEEIAHAARAGLDYWAFCYYPGMKAMNYGLELYLTSRRRDDVRFCLLLQSGHLGRSEDWPATATSFVEYMRQPTYQNVLGNRPLVYLLLTGRQSLEQRFGPGDGPRRAFDDLREAARAAGLGNPYLVLQDGSPAVAAKQARALGFDAISAYATTGGGQGRQPYSVLAAHVRGFWEECAKTGSCVVPLVMAGWDRRPRIANPVPWEARPRGESIETALHFIPPRPEELAASLRDAMQWTAGHARANPARAILICAWNEFDEGGWLAPTLHEGDARLRAIGAVLRPRDER